MCFLFACALCMAACCLPALHRGRVMGLRGYAHAIGSKRTHGGDIGGDNETFIRIYFTEVDLFIHK